MKGLISICFALLLSANVQAACSSANGSIDGLGNAKSQPKCWESVHNSETTVISEGAYVVLNTSSDNGISVSIPGTTAGTIPFCVMDESCAAGAKGCKCQTRGFNDKILFDGVTTAAAGELVFISESTAGRVQATAKGSIAASDFPLGVFFDASASAGAIEVNLQLQ